MKRSSAPIPVLTADTLPMIWWRGVNAVVSCSAGICEADVPPAVCAEQVCNKKVSDHHAIIPTIVAGETDIGSLPAGEREILMMIARQVLRSVSESYRYRETVAVLTCDGNRYTAKGKTVLNMGWKAYNEKEPADKILPELSDGDELQVADSKIKEGMTKPPARFTEDSLLSAMEVAGAKDMPEDAERKGLGTPATRAGMIEKLIATGFVERKKAKKTTHLVPAQTGVSLITVLPEQLQSPLLTAEWEYKLKMVEKRRDGCGCVHGGNQPDGERACENLLCHQGCGSPVPVRP